MSQKWDQHKQFTQFVRKNSVYCADGFCRAPFPVDFANDQILIDGVRLMDKIDALQKRVQVLEMLTSQMKIAPTTTGSTMTKMLM